MLLLPWKNLELISRVHLASHTFKKWPFRIQARFLFFSASDRSSVTSLYAHNVDISFFKRGEKFRICCCCFLVDNNDYYYYYYEYDYDFTLFLDKGNFENMQHDTDLADILFI